MGKLFKIGQIINTHGVKGEVKVYPLTQEVDKFKRLKTVLVDGIEKKILGVKFQKDRVILKIEGIESMNDAETYKQKYIEIPRANEPELPPDTYYVADLKECIVYDTNEKELGRVFDVISTPNNDVYWIKEPKELLIPVLRDIVLDVNIDSKKIIIKPVGEWQDED
ncbi:ribosome maturation factor RimM [Clostridium saccharobutylicum]|uniref:Ribosome maturation factor RimM n=2 Tax=Clostridium saccharobutylicum TaxID=169679 RepID=U5MSM2_CLOSA|nr:ribosome maturation factor RimM [Clostridium saccharobutylicum]AGX42402.1 ribosome maturation factor RimM [Clostridium saccharobutylicum DSM 13864]AQR89684.1 ribosome maturation factor RimM [Clostridium saccharobutylicum]AQR99586.1 ribosome maturation factor RimM [Clostridium saccharobutylicum]AQS09316.1 ribosome maturation factor RimM [Clostridium saccharobutylicum]AQS13572.1 ribosome maturation factor RimM [Clostridium saccharobutylicum]